MASAQEECGCCTQLGWILSCQLSDTQTRFSPSSSTLYCWEAVFMRRKRCLFQMKKIIMDRFLKWSQSLTVEVGIWWYSPVLFWFAPLRSRISSFSRTRTTMTYTSNPFYSDHFHGRMHLPSSPSFKSPLATLTSLLVRVLLTHSVLWLHTFLALLNPQSPMVVETKSLLLAATGQTVVDLRGSSAPQANGMEERTTCPPCPWPLLRSSVIPLEKLLGFISMAFAALSYCGSWWPEKGSSNKTMHTGLLRNSQILSWILVAWQEFSPGRLNSAQFSLATSLSCRRDEISVTDEGWSGRVFNFNTCVGT